MSCLEKERKPMMPLKTLDILFRRRYVPNTQYYFTDRQHALKNTPTISPKFSKVPASQKLLSYIKYSDRKEKFLARQRMTLPLHLKDNFKVAAARDISRRLFIKPPPDDVRTVLEIHPEFYSVIEGRPIRTFDDIKVYISNIRGYAMNRQQIGYRKDIILRLQQNIDDEGKIFAIILDKYKHHIKDFQHFLTDDYKKACNNVSKAEKVNSELVAKNVELMSYVTKSVIVSNIIFKLDSMRNTLKMYRKFLLHISPYEWRQNHDDNLKSEGSLLRQPGFLDDAELDDDMDINRTLEMARNELTNPQPAHLYFNKPDDILEIFNNMESQSREYLLKLSSTGVPYRMLMDRIRELKLETKNEFEYFQYYIEFIKIEIEREEYNEQRLQQKFFSILIGPFHHSVASRDTLKLKICIEYVYEQIFGKCEEGHETIHDPMKILEVLYEEYNLRFDGLDFKTINAAREEAFAQDLKMMQDAYKAERELYSFNVMTDAMNRAFVPPAKFKRPPVKKFKRKKIVDIASTEKLKGVDVIRQRKEPNQEELEGLRLFTDWCPGMDPAPFLKEYYQYAKPALEYVPRNTSKSD